MSRTNTGPAAPLSAEPELDALFSDSLEAIFKFDAASLRQSLRQAAVHLSRRDWIERFVVPLLRRIGDLWEQGDVCPAQEHLASAVLRTHVGALLQSYRAPDAAPRLVVSTPGGQLHELGALLAAATAAGEGWHVTFLGGNLPAEDVAVAAAGLRARASFRSRLAELAATGSPAGFATF